MSEAGRNDLDRVAEEVAGWVKAAFPERRCPKCGNDSFYVLDPPPQPLPKGPLTFSPWPVAKIACARCGYIEEHLTGILKNTLENNGFEAITPIEAPQ